MLFIRRNLEIKDTADAPKWANYLDLHLEFDEDGKLFTQLYDKPDDFPPDDLVHKFDTYVSHVEWFVH